MTVVSGKKQKCVHYDFGETTEVDFLIDTVEILYTESRFLGL
jgi:hypothetical protein